MSSSGGADAIRRSSHGRGAVALRPGQGLRAPARKRTTVARKTDPFPSAEPSVSAHLPARLGVRGARRGGGVSVYRNVPTAGEGQKGRGGFCIRKPAPHDRTEDAAAKGERAAAVSRGPRRELEFPSTGTFPQRGRGSKGAGWFLYTKNPRIVTESRAPRRRGSGPARVRGAQCGGEFSSTGTFRSGRGSQGRGWFLYTETQRCAETVRLPRTSLR